MVPYTYFKSGMGFCVFYLCCRSNIADIHGVVEGHVRSSICLNKKEYVHQSTFHLGYPKIMSLTGHKSWVQMSSVFQYALPCFTKKVISLGLRSRNDCYSRRVMHGWLYVFWWIDDLFKYDSEKFKMYLCCDRLCDVRSPKSVSQMKYTASDGCFHRHIEMRNSDGFLVKKYLCWIWWNGHHCGWWCWSYWCRWR